MARPFESQDHDDWLEFMAYCDELDRRDELEADELESTWHDLEDDCGVLTGSELSEIEAIESWDEL